MLSNEIEDGKSACDSCRLHTHQFTILSIQITDCTISTRGLSWLRATGFLSRSGMTFTYLRGQTLECAIRAAVSSLHMLSLQPISRESVLIEETATGIAHSSRHIGTVLRRDGDPNLTLSSLNTFDFQILVLKRHDKVPQRYDRRVPVVFERSS